MKIVLGIDTSCYTTSAAAVDKNGSIAGEARKLLPVDKGQRGLRQSEAVFAHVRQLPLVMAQLMQGLPNGKLQAVCVSSRPRDGEASYMPVFVAGESFAKTIALAAGVPLFTTSHQQGHIAAALVDSGLDESQFIALHLSGGTTDVLLYEDGVITALGGSLDIHAGQLVDRTGVALGLSFPAGPSLEKLAMKGNGTGAIPTSIRGEGIACNLSGAETKVMEWINKQEKSPEDIAAQVYDFLARTLARLIEKAVEQTGVSNVLIAGGVASSSLLRNLLKRRIDKMKLPVHTYYGRPELSSDNSVGVALIGLKQYNNLQGGMSHGSTID